MSFLIKFVIYYYYCYYYYYYYYHKNYNFLACDCFKNVPFFTNSLAKLLSDSLLLDSLLLDSLLSDSLIMVIELSGVQFSLKSYA